MSIILVRHGETALNASRVMQPPDTPLSKRGVLQAEAVGRRLAAGRIGGILGSDLARAWLTAEAIGRHSGVAVQPSALLHERNFGALRGRPYDQLGFDPLSMAEAPPQGESAADFARRVQRAFELMVQRHAALDGGDLVVVTHGLLIRVLLAGALAMPAPTVAELHLGNTSVSIFAATAPHGVSLLNCTRHLDAAASDDARGLSGG